MAKRKVTLLMDERLSDAVREAVGSGAARSQTELIERAVSAFLERHRRETLRREYEEAAKDPRFLKDLWEVERDFQTADAEAWHMLNAD